MTTIHPDQIAAVETALRPYITDPKVSLFGAFMEAMNAYLDAAPGKKKRKKIEGEVDGFGVFYQTFPRRVGRRVASKAYIAALERSTREIILAGCKRYAEAMKGTEERYIKHPATWLNSDGWLDEMGQLSLAAAAFESTSLDGWVKRLCMLAGRDGASKGTWRASWGPKPGESGCKVPEEAGTEYRRLYPRKTA